MSEYKDITYYPDNVVITHYLAEEYSDKDNPQYNYKTFYQHVLQRYKHTESKGMCKILEKNESNIVIQMKRYNMLLSNSCSPNICTNYALYNLFYWMYYNKIIQIDFTPRNIGYDDNGELHIIDLDTTIELINSNKKQYQKWLQMYKIEFENAGLGDAFNAAFQMFCERFRHSAV